MLVRRGNVIKANDERTLVGINSLRPAEVQFTVAGRHLPSILRRVQQGTLEVGVLPEGDTGPVIMGRITAVNNEVDRTTGTIRLYALFSNEDNRLWPGQFVRVTLQMDMLQGAVLVPDNALQEGLSGRFVFLAMPAEEGAGEGQGAPDRVSAVNVASETGPDGRAVILSGVSEGDVVVVEGQLGLNSGDLAVDVGAREQADK